MKKFLIALILLCTLFASGCDYVNKTYEKQGIIFAHEVARPRMKLYSTDDVLNTRGLYYCVDTNTNVVYLMYVGGSSFGMCPYLKANGSPMLSSDLGLD